MEKTLATKIARDGEESIEEPKGVPFELAGKEYTILPMPDSKLVTAFGHLNRLASVASDIIDEARRLGQAFDQVDLFLKLPQFMASVIPVATKLIAIELDLDEEFVENNCPLAKKVEAINAIFKAEDINIIVKNLMGIKALLEEPLPTIPVTDAPK